MSKCIESKELSETLTLSRCTDGFWLYDKTRGMNLSMRAKTEQEALMDCISYYQRRLLEVEKKYNDVNEKVDAFVSQFTEEVEDYF